MTKTGTPEYNAPEIFLQTEYDEKVDIWSTGIVMFMILNSCSPFETLHLPTLVE